MSLQDQVIKEELVDEQPEQPIVNDGAEQVADARREMQPMLREVKKEEDVDEEEEEERMVAADSGHQVQLAERVVKNEDDEEAVLGARAEVKVEMEVDEVGDVSVEAPGEIVTAVAMTETSALRVSRSAPRRTSRKGQKSPTERERERLRQEKREKEERKRASGMARSRRQDMRTRRSGHGYNLRVPFQRLNVTRRTAAAGKTMKAQRGKNVATTSEKEEYICPVCIGHAKNNCFKCNTCQNWVHFKCANLRYKHDIDSQTLECIQCKN